MKSAKGVWTPPGLNAGEKMTPAQIGACWEKPLPPAPTTCACGATVGAVYVEPVYGDARLMAGRPMIGTGCWASRKACTSCETKAAKEVQATRAAATAKIHAARVQDALERAGFEARELPMTLGNLRVPSAIAEALGAWTKGEKALYLYGKDTGTGKTHAAVGALKRRIGMTGERGLFRPVPVLVKDLRQAVGRFKDGAMVDELIAAPALVLDDIGVECPTGKVLEALYTVIDAWYRKDRQQLIITSNLSLDALGKHLDDRIASRLTKLCRVIEFAGKDQRLPGFEEKL